MEYLPSILGSPAHEKLPAPSRRNFQSARSPDRSDPHATKYSRDCLSCSSCSLMLTKLLAWVQRLSNRRFTITDNSDVFDNLTTSAFVDAMVMLSKNHLEDNDNFLANDNIQRDQLLQTLQKAAGHLKAHQIDIAARPSIVRNEFQTMRQFDIRFLSIQCLIESLYELTLPQLSLSVPFEVANPDKFWIENRLVDQLLQNAGWETSEVSFLPRDVRFRYYVISLRKGDSELRRRRSSAPIPKEKLRPKQQYYPSHCLSHCRCRFLKIDLRPSDKEVIYPHFHLVTLSRPDKGPSSLQLKEASFSSEGSAKTPYVAISHVRSDGLGSTLENGLPTCQAEFLQELSNRLLPQQVPPVAFYIDTLCVPLRGSTKRFALRNMQYVFGNASKVLALDRELCGVGASPLPQENLTRIRYSTFIRRLWTVAECAASQDVFFCFKHNTLKSLDELHKALINDKEYPLLSNVSYKFRRKNTLSSKDFANFPLALAWLSDDLHVLKIYSKEQAEGKQSEPLGSDAILNPSSEESVASLGLYDRSSLRSLLRLGFLALPNMRYFAEAAEAESLDQTAKEILQVYAETVSKTRAKAEEYRKRPLPCNVPEHSTVDQVLVRLIRLQQCCKIFEL